MKNERQNAALWHSATVEGVAKALGVDVKTGLSDAEVKSRTRRYGINRIYKEERTSLSSYLSYCASDLLLILLLLTSAVAAVFGRGEDAAVIIPILVISIILRTFAYISARRYIESASSASAVMPSVSVIRGGKVRRIDSRDVVKGDVIRLRRGDIVPSDCRIVSCRGLGVYEENITGSRGITYKEACEIEPGMAPSLWKNMLFAGSSIFSGYCIALSVEVGGDTLAVRTKGELKMVRGGELRLTRLLERYSRVWGAVMTLVVFVTAGLNLIFSQRGIYDVFFMGLALAAASMCEYYSAMGDIAAAKGLSALSAGDGYGNDGSYVRGVRSIEALAELDAVIFQGDGVLVADGMMCRYSIMKNGALIDSTDTDDAVGLFRSAALSTGLYSKNGSDGKAASESVKFINDYIKINSYSTDGLYSDESYPVLYAGVADGLPFDAQLTYDGTGYIAYLSGNARDVTLVSVSILDGENAVPMSENVKLQLLRAVSYHERRGASVFAVAKKNTPFHSKERMNFVMSDLTLVGIMAFYKPLAPDSENAVSACLESGIRLVMTGEGRSSALLAQRAGIIKSRDDMILAKEFSLLDDNGKRSAAETKKLLLGFDAKLLAVFIDYMQRSGKKVAYVADPKHDMTSELRLLHGVGASFALSLDGVSADRIPPAEEINEKTDGVAQTLKMQADAIIPRANVSGGGLPTLVECASYSKKIYENVASIAEYLVTSQSARMFTVLYSVLFHTTSLGAGQILLWGLIFDFFAVMILASERPDYRSLRRKSDIYERLSHPFSGIGKSVAYGILWGSLTCLVTALFYGSGAMAGSVIFISVLLSLIAVVGENRSEYSVFSPRRRINISTCLFIGSALGLLILCTVLPAVSEMVGIIPPDPSALVISAIPPIILFAVYEFDRFLSSKVKKNEI